MKAYVMSLLQKLAEDGKPIGDNEIIQWANEKVLSIIKLAPMVKLSSDYY